MANNIDGSCDPKFKRVRDAFAENFARGREVGAAVSITIEGKPVVDLWGGFADAAGKRPWTRDTLVNVFSTTKGIAATCAHRLADQGKLDIDSQVTRYWPEFEAAGKKNIPVRWLLCHRAGLPAVRKPLAPESIYQWNTMCAALAAETPWWEPGTRHGYHALTYGYLVGEVVRRAAGVTLGSYFRDQIAGPLGLDAHIGLDAREDSRVADMVPPPPPDPAAATEFAKRMADPESVTFKAIMNPPVSVFDPAVIGSRAWRAMEQPAVNGHANARAIARMYSALACGGELDGVRVLTRDSLTRCHAEQAFGLDAVLGVRTRIGLGFMLSDPERPMGPNPHTFGHPGAGGSIGFADPIAKLSFGYTMNKMGQDPLIDNRAAALFDAAYACL